MTGFIRKIVNKDGRCFGFITGDNGVDYFFLPSMIQRTTGYQFDDARLNHRVEFTPIAGPKEGSWRAIEIQRQVHNGKPGPVEQP